MRCGDTLGCLDHPGLVPGRILALKRGNHRALLPSRASSILSGVSAVIPSNSRTGRSMMTPQLLPIC